MTFYEDVLAERLRAHEKHGGDGNGMESDTIGWDRRLTITGEELGEACRALLEHGPGPEMYAELVQLAAMAGATADAIARKVGGLARVAGRESLPAGQRDRILAGAGGVRLVITDRGPDFPVDWHPETRQATTEAPRTAQVAGRTVRAGAEPAGSRYGFEGTGGEDVGPVFVGSYSGTCGHPECGLGVDPGSELRMVDANAWHAQCAEELRPGAGS